jgi:hypothetical protein
MPDPVALLNKFLVGVQPNGQIRILNMPLQARPEGLEISSLPQWPATAPLTADEALNLAAWLVEATGRRADLDRILDEIEARPG